MNWQQGTILVVLLAFVVVPGLVALLTPRKRDRFVQRDVVAQRHRAIVRNGFKSRQGLR